MLSTGSLTPDNSSFCECWVRPSVHFQYIWIEKASQLGNHINSKTALQAAAKKIPLGLSICPCLRLRARQVLTDSHLRCIIFLTNPINYFTINKYHVKNQHLACSKWCTITAIFSDTQHLKMPSLLLIDWKDELGRWKSSKLKEKMLWEGNQISHDNASSIEIKEFSSLAISEFSSISDATKSDAFYIS